MLNTNSQKADAAAALAETHADATGNINDSMDAWLGDLLTDIQHLCKREEIDFAQVVRVSEMNFQAEA